MISEVLFAFGVGALAFLCFGRSVRGPFLFDDPFIVDMRKQFETGYPFRNPDGSFVKWYALRGHAWALHGGYWLCWRLWRFNPEPWHLLNIQIHGANAMLLYCILRNIPALAPIAKAAALVFVVHPLNVSAVSYISGRGALQGLFFALFGVLLALHGLMPLAFVCSWLSLSSRKYAWVYLAFYGVVFLR